MLKFAGKDTKATIEIEGEQTSTKEVIPRRWQDPQNAGCLKACSVSQHLVPQDFFTKPDNQSQALRLNALFVDAAAKCARGASAMTLDDAKPLLLTGDPVTMPVPVSHQADPNNKV